MNAADVCLLKKPCVAGMRCLSPNAKWWPTWADVFPNIALMPKIEASTFIMHVSPPTRQQACTVGFWHVGSLFRTKHLQSACEEEVHRAPLQVAPQR